VTVTTRVFLIDDHELFREGLKLLLGGSAEFLVVGEAATVAHAVAQLERTSFELLILDMTLPGASGLSLLRALQHRQARPSTLVLSMHDEPDRVADALIAGATGYVLKSDPASTLLTGMRAAAAGHRFLSPGIDASAVRRLVLASGHAGVVGPLDRLTAREREVFQMIVRDYTTPGIARHLGITVKTVETHREHIFRKLEVHSICELVRFAARHHLLEWEQRGREPSATW
jgi:DNA-binding NarL/FixJ family response regulator